MDLAVWIDPEGPIADFDFDGAGRLAALRVKAIAVSVFDYRTGATAATGELGAGIVGLGHGAG